MQARLRQDRLQQHGTQQIRRQHQSGKLPSAASTRFRFLRFWLNLAAFGLVVSAPAGAADVIVTGLFTNKALVQIDGGTMQMLSVGEKTASGIALVSVDSEAAVFDIDSKQARIELGRARMGPSVPSVARLTSDTRGHFFADGVVNGVPVRFLVDTGATVVALPARLAQRLAPDYRSGVKTTMNTANGNVSVYRIKLATMSVGDLTLRDIDAGVLEGDGLTEPLLGMSFLKRTDVKLGGNIMTLTKRD